MSDQAGTVGGLPESAIAMALRGGRLRVAMGPFVVSIRSKLAELAGQMRVLYRDYRLEDEAGVADFHVRVDAPPGVRRFVRPQAEFWVDGGRPFEPMARPLAMPLLEWGINWAIAMRAHQYLMLHAAVLERDGRALIMPAEPGAGKSTLCAALAHSGWRLFSDEFGLVDLRSGAMVPIPRVIPLKNQSVPVMRDFAPTARFGPAYENTRKGTVGYLCPPTRSVSLAHVTARPAWIVFPRWRAGAALETASIDGAATFLRVASNAFNYEAVGADGFEAVAAMTQACESHRLDYSRLDEAVEWFDRLARAA